MRLGHRLKHAREKRDITQEQLAKLVPGANQPMISALEKRDSLTTLLLFGFAKALDVDPRWLLTGFGESGLDKKPVASKPDPLLMQLVDLWGQLTPDSRDELLSMANYLHAKDHPDPSTSNPFGKRKPAKTRS